MARFEHESHSFVIRLWQESHPDGQIWRGWIEHVPSRQRHYFQNQQTLNEIFSNYLTEVPDLEKIFSLSN